MRGRVLPLPPRRLQSLQNRKRGLPPFAVAPAAPSLRQGPRTGLEENPMSEHGIHHVTATAAAPRRNRDFYTGTLGLRLVKKTVNFDDPGTYHLYFGDETGRPGTILTFFPWAHVAPGRAGIGQAQETAFRVPKESIGFWTHRFVEKGVPHEASEKRFGETVLPFPGPGGEGRAPARP